MVAYILPGSVATCLRCGGIFRDDLLLKNYYRVWYNEKFESQSFGDVTSNSSDKLFYSMRNLAIRYCLVSLQVCFHANGMALNHDKSHAILSVIVQRTQSFPIVHEDVTV